MRYNLHRNWIDIDERNYQHPPNVVIRAADMATYKKLIESADLWAAVDPSRRVIYEDSTGTKFSLELVPYVHPTGAGALTIGTLAYAADGTATYTPTKEGYILSELGALAPVSSLARACAGMLFTDYYYHQDDGLDIYESHRVITINEGDFLWLIRKGIVYGASANAVTALDAVIISSGTAGKVAATPALDPTNAATLGATYLLNASGTATPAGKCIGQALETIGGAGLLKMSLELPPRRIRTHS